MFFVCYDNTPQKKCNISIKEIQTKQMRNTNEIQTYTKKKRKSQRSDMEFVKNFTPADFQAKNLYCQFHLILTVLVRKNTKNE